MDGRGRVRRQKQRQTEYRDSDLENSLVCGDHVRLVSGDVSGELAMLRSRQELEKGATLRLPPHTYSLEECVCSMGLFDDRGAVWRVRKIEEPA